MIKKIKWKELINDKTTVINNHLNTEWITRQSTYLKDVLNTIYAHLPNTNTPDLNIWEEVVAFLTSSESNPWNDVEIFISTLKYSNNLIFSKLEEEITRKTDYYIRLLEDEVASEINETRSNKGTNTKKTNASDSVVSNGTIREDTSETPQLGQVDFAQDTLDYRSGMGRTTSSGNDTRTIENNVSGSNDLLETIKKTNMTFTEKFKLRLEKYNYDYVSFITSIPSLIYDYYALDCTPLEDSMQALWDLKNAR